MLKKVAESHPEDTKITVLDFACGYTQVIPVLKLICDELKKELVYVGVDRNPEAISYNQEQISFATNVNFIHEDGLNIKAINGQLSEAGITGGFHIFLLLHPEILSPMIETKKAFDTFLTILCPYFLVQSESFFMSFYDEREREKAAYALNELKKGWRTFYNTHDSQIDFKDDVLVDAPSRTSYKVQISGEMMGMSMNRNPAELKVLEQHCLTVRYQGRWVMIQRLEKKPEFNGLIGKVLEVLHNGRCKVEIKDPKKTLSVFPTHLSFETPDSHEAIGGGATAASPAP